MRITQDMYDKMMGKETKEELLTFEDYAAQTEKDGAEFYESLSAALAQSEKEWEDKFAESYAITAAYNAHVAKEGAAALDRATFAKNWREANHPIEAATPDAEQAEDTTVQSQNDVTPLTQSTSDIVPPTKSADDIAPPTQATTKVVPLTQKTESSNGIEVSGEVATGFAVIAFVILMFAYTRDIINFVKAIFRKLAKTKIQRLGCVLFIISLLYTYLNRDRSTWYLDDIEYTCQVILPVVIPLIMVLGIVDFLIKWVKGKE